MKKRQAMKKRLSFLAVTAALLAVSGVVAATPGAQMGRALSGAAAPAAPSVQMHGGVSGGGAVSAAPSVSTRSGFAGQGGSHGHSGGFHGHGNRGHGHGHHGHGGHGHHHFHGSGAVVLSAPLYYGYGYPAYWDYPRAAPPTVYVEQADEAVYYCPDYGYYPTVQTCPTGWLLVIPQQQ